MAKAQTQTQTSLTPKQAEVKITNLLRGLDNNNTAIAQKQAQNIKAVEQIKQLVPSLGVESKAKVKAEKVAKPAKVKVEKTNGAVVKAAETKVVAAEPKAAKPAKVAKPKVMPAAKPDERPPLKRVAHDIIAANGNKAMPAAAIYSATKQYGSWSRQSLYNALKDEKSFVQSDQGYKNIGPGAKTKQLAHGEQDDADRFVAAVESQQSTANLS